MGELIWERVGFGLIGSISGFIYGLAISTILVPLVEPLKLEHLLLSFSCSFGLAGLLLGGRVSEAALGALKLLYYFWGYLVGSLGIGGLIVADEALPSKKSGGITFFISGLFVALICVIVLT